MLLLRVYVAIAKLDITLKSENWAIAPEATQLEKLNKARQNLTEYAENLVKSLPSDETSEYLVYAEQTVSTLKLLPAVKHHLSVLDMAKAMYCEYLSLILTLKATYPAAFYTIGESNDARRKIIFDDLIQIQRVLPNVDPKPEHLHLFLNQDCFKELRSALTKLLFNFWDELIESINRLSSDPQLLKRAANESQFAIQLETILEVPGRLNKLLEQMVIFESNVNNFNQIKNSDLSATVADLVKKAEFVFRYADAKLYACKLLTKLNEKLAYLKNELINQEEIAEDVLRAIGADLGEIERLKALAVEMIVAVKDRPPLESKHSFRKIEGKEIVDLLMQLANKQPSQALVLSRSSSSSLVVSSSKVDSLMVRSGNSRAFRASIYALPKSLFEDEIVMQDVNKLQATFRDIVLENLQAKEQKNIVTSQLNYINAQNRPNLSAFYAAGVAKAEAARIGYLGIASNLLAQELTAEQMMGATISKAGSLFGPFGVIFQIIGSTMTAAAARQEKMRAINISYVGLHGEFMTTFEEFMRELTLQYELQIRLLKNAKVAAEELNESSNSESSSGSIFRFFSKDKVLDKVRDQKLLCPDVAPPQLLAEYVVAIIFANLLLADNDKLPRNPLELKQFFYTALLEKPLKLKLDDLIFDKLKFYSFEMIHGDNWHAGNIFRKPSIAVKNRNDSIDYWGNPGEIDNPYLWRIGSAEEAQHLGYVVIRTQQPVIAAAPKEEVKAIEAASSLMIKM